MCIRGRAVKAADSKSAGVSPRRFESCRMRHVSSFPFLIFVTNVDEILCNFFIGAISTFGWAQSGMVKFVLHKGYPLHSGWKSLILKIRSQWSEI